MRSTGKFEVGSVKNRMAEGFIELQLDSLCLTQALLGVVSDNFRYVSITRQAEKITIQIILATHCGEDFEEIDDLKTEFEALQPGPVDFDVEVFVSEEPIILEPPNESSIVVFKRRE
ncbi:hypothetical protein Pan258_23550 [Symmachiella dynata]|nr:hypothetical protein Pan258_23550 [Symmachiella dynata]